MRNRQKILNLLSEKNENKLYQLIYKYYELLAYLIFGVLTTLVNFIIFSVLENILGQDSWYFSNLPAILIAILFAFFTNRSFVFESDGNIWTEMYKFFSARIIISLVFEYGTAFLLFNIMKFDAVLNMYFFSVSWFKIISLIMVLVGNYVASKLFVFKKSGKARD